MPSKDMGEDIKVQSVVVNRLQSRQIEYLKKALAAGSISQAEYNFRTQDYNPDETGLEQFTVDRDVISAPRNERGFSSYADKRNQEIKATAGTEGLPEGEAAIDQIFGGDAAARSDVDGGLDIFNTRHQAGQKFEQSGSAEIRDISGAMTKDLVKIAGLVVAFEKDNSDILPDGWRSDPTMVSEVSKIIATSEGFGADLVKSVIRDMCD